ncbi:adenosylcobinamide-GDP ribazoletransferase [Conexibacter sp. DBS9H8]|uniref:adenosylcobinamide-GDP ribazoletransferase n=1 Tax=Conexibacter sp. DBS9H8 TaxID=2937801 RepID=UPI00200F7A6D|nr:adenosylcobinamide-GDP ribazoletransferase [Conexibacter sp. DBS9H8]
MPLARPISRPRQELRALGAAVSFLTRIPVPGVFDAADLRRASVYFPLVGAGIGSLCGRLARAWGPPVALTVEALLTGALHLDALADSADGLGGRDRAHALEIMRDSRLGSFGAVALILDLTLRGAALQRCADPVRAARSAGALARAVPVVLAVTLPYVRAEGTGAALETTTPARAVLGAGLAAGLSGDPAAIGAAALFTAASAGFWRDRIGGVTGDVLGASIELGSTLLLVLASTRTGPAVIRSWSGGPEESR